MHMGSVQEAQRKMNGNGYKEKETDEGQGERARLWEKEGRELLSEKKAERHAHIWSADSVTTEI